MSTNLPGTIDASSGGRPVPPPPPPSPTREGRPHFLVTAGPTREKIDLVRDWGNIFTGKTGLDIALAFLDLGDVTLLTSNEGHAREYDGYFGKGGMMGVETFRTHTDLHALLAQRMAQRVDVVAMSAAVADYQPEGVYRLASKRVAAAAGNGREVWEVELVSAPKVKSTFEEIAVLGRRTPKLIDEFRGTWGFRGVLVKFKLEVGVTDQELIRVGDASRTASGADLMVANTLAMARPESVAAGAMQGESKIGAFLIDDHGAKHVERHELAARIAAWVAERRTTSPAA